MKDKEFEAIKQDKDRWLNNCNAQMMRLDAKC